MGYTALIWAAKVNYNDIVINLVDAGANRDLIDNLGETALLWATKNNIIASVTKLAAGKGTSLDI